MVDSERFVVTFRHESSDNAAKVRSVKQGNSDGQRKFLQQRQQHRPWVFDTAWTSHVVQQNTNTNRPRILRLGLSNCCADAVNLANNSATDCRSASTGNISYQSPDIYWTQPSEYTSTLFARYLPSVLWWFSTLSSRSHFCPKLSQHRNRNFAEPNFWVLLINEWGQLTV